MEHTSTEITAQISTVVETTPSKASSKMSLSETTQQEISPSSHEHPFPDDEVLPKTKLQKELQCK